MNGPAPGIYNQQGTYGGRGDFFSNGRLYQLYWVFYAGKPVNRRRRDRRALHMEEGVYHGEWSEAFGERVCLV